MLEDLTRDARLAVRLLRRDLGFTFAAALTLALGIGAAGTIFTIFDGMFLKGLPVDGPDRIVTVRAIDRQGRPLQLSPPEFDDWRAAAHSFAGLGAYAGANAILADEGRPSERVPASYVSADVFTLLGERPVLGRVLTPADDRRGAPAVIVIGEAIWKERYGGDPRIVGRPVTVNGEPAVVVGVMPARFEFPVVDKAWLPLAMAPQARDRQRDARTLAAVGRLADGASRAQARAELDAIAARLARVYPDTDAGLRASVEPYTGRFSGLNNPWSDALFAAGFLLLIGCANVSSLLLARASGRARDLAIRTSLGATRWRIVRQLLVESTMLAAVAAALGALLTWAGVRFWIWSMPAANWPYWFRWTIDRRIVVFLALASGAAAVLAGLAPAVQLSRTGLADLMKEDARSGTTGLRARRWTSGLMAGQLALTLVLLAGAGLMIRTTIALLRIDRVVDTPHILLAAVRLPDAAYPTGTARVRLVEALRERLEARPPTRFTTAASAMPFLTAPLRALDVAGRPVSATGRGAAVSYVAIASHYFETLGVHLLVGRPFSSTDGTSGHLSAIVNQRFVQMFFGGSSPLGARIRLIDPNAPGGEPPWLTIVGVSPSVRQHYAQDLDPVVYVPYRQDPVSTPTLLSRAGGDPSAIVPVLRAVLHELDPDLVLFNVAPLELILSGTGFANRVFLTFFGVFAGFALLLSAIGLYASTRHAVVERRHEIGVRMALGAEARQIVWLFTSRILIVLAVGGAFGLAGAFAATRLMRGFLVQTSPSDPASLASMTLLLAIVATVATVVPARRAARMDPVSALRCD
ncbi:MAG: ABC transporter permease [Betaproteobacteria bacterium]